MTWWRHRRELLAAAARGWAADHPLAPALPRESALRLTGFPDTALLDAAADGLGMVRDGSGIREANARPLLSDRAQDAPDTLCARLRGEPFGAPGQPEPAELGLTTPHLRAAVDRGLLFRVGQGVYVHPDAVRLAPARLAPLPQPFTLSAGRRTLGTSRRVAVPLFELLDRLGHTRPTPDGLRHLVASSDVTP
ncbi:SelB C-terminal domain-containing protein [Streptomyces sp. NPDC051286]|uniref:SelB domain-containing protein n=1 Tax=Streptomyces sp. NPDC051286 TaxID=3365647 RepID=UPI0037B8F41F